MWFLRNFLLLGVLAVATEKSQAVSTYFIGTYESSPQYIKGRNGFPATCGKGENNALKFNILDSGLTGVRGQTSFRSADFKRNYLADVFGEIYLDSYDDTHDFQQSASFQARKNYYYLGTTAYESLIYRGYFLMCKNGKLVIGKPTSKQAARASFTTKEATTEADNWTKCTRTCGGGTQVSLKRFCFTPLICEEPRSRPCNTHTCPQDSNPCSPSPCRNGGRCFPQGREYRCTCPSEFTGKNCQIEKDLCTPNPCQNGGRCFSSQSEIYCDCRNGFTGYHCETAMSPCSPNPCQNGGKCFRSGNSYYCRCASGFTGDNCANAKNPCDSEPCMNGGTCFQSGQSFMCRCRTGFSGKDCSVSDNACKPSTCLNGGTCVPTGNTYTCRCAAGYTGKNCGQKITKNCDPNPCRNGGTCVETSSGSDCKCAIGYYGDRCQSVLRLGQWSPCSRTCGGGTRYKGNPCQEDRVDKCPRVYEDCNTQNCATVTCSGSKSHRYGIKSQCCEKKTGTPCSGPQNQRTTKRVIGGVPSKRGEWPWMAGLYHKSSKTFFCGGSIVSNRWIVTAGHCAAEYTASRINVLVGTNDLAKPNSGHKWFDVERIVLHPTFDNPIDDIALLRVKSDITFTAYIKPVCLPNGERLEEEVECFAPGWGVAFKKDIDLRKISDVLRHVGLRTLPHDACVQGYFETGHQRGVTSKIICSGLLAGGKDTCIGDSGGPLVCQRKTSCEWYLAGVTSFGPTECGVGNIPGGFMDVEQYETWIKLTIN